MKDTDHVNVGRLLKIEDQMIWKVRYRPKAKPIYQMGIARRAHRRMSADLIETYLNGINEAKGRVQIVLCDVGSVIINVLIGAGANRDRLH